MITITQKEALVFVLTTAGDERHILDDVVATEHNNGALIFHQGQHKIVVSKENVLDFCGAIIRYGALVSNKETISDFQTASKKSRIVPKRKATRRR